MLAMHPRTPRGARCPALSLASIASMLAPTDDHIPCRSGLARDEPESAAECQVPSVIVDLHREHARSYR